MRRRNNIQPRDSSSPAPGDGKVRRSGAHRGAWRGDGSSDLFTYLEIVMRRKRLVGGIFFVVVLGVLFGTLLQPSVYRATGLLEIRRQGQDNPLGEGLFANDNLDESNLRTQHELLQSAALSRRVIRALDLYRLPAFGAGEEAEVDKDEAAKLQRAVKAFQDRLIVAPKVGSRLVEVGFDFEDPKIAAAVTNAVLTHYVEMRAGAGRDAGTWLDQQMESVRADLKTSEQKLQEYAEANGLPYMVDEDATQQIRRVRRLEDELADAEARRYEKESLYDLVVRQQGFQAVDDRVVEELSLKLATLRSEYARLSSTFTDDYPPVREVQQQIEQVERQLEQEQERIARKIENEYQAALQSEELVREALDGERAAADALAQRSGRYHLLQSEVLANRELFSALQQTQKQVQVSAALEATGIAIVDRATPPETPHSPQLKYNMALAVMTGLLLGIGGAFIREYFDNTVRTEHEVDRVVDVPILAMIPSFESPVNSNGSLRRRTGQRLLPWSDGESEQPDQARSWTLIERDRATDESYHAIVEAFSTLRTAMLFKDGPPPRSLLVSSCQPGDGKTTVSLNVALSLRRLDRKVLLVDGDLRRPALHRALDMARDPGLSEYLQTGCNWRRMVRLNQETGLHVLPSGRPTESPGDLLSKDRMESMIRAAEEEYDFVIIDAPALFINAPDARLLAQMVEGVVVVVRSGTTPRALLGRICEAAKNVLGVVVNDLNPSDFPDYYREYSASSGEDVFPAARANPGEARTDGWRGGARERGTRVGIEAVTLDVGKTEGEEEDEAAVANGADEERGAVEKLEVDEIELPIVRELADFLAELDDVSTVRELQKRDQRKTAQKHYDRRIHELAG